MDTRNRKEQREARELMAQLGIKYTHALRLIREATQEKTSKEKAQ